MRKKHIVVLRPWHDAKDTRSSRNQEIMPQIYDLREDGVNYREIGGIFNLSRERIRQLYELEKKRRKRRLLEEEV